MWSLFQSHLPAFRVTQGTCLDSFSGEGGLRSGSVRPVLSPQCGCGAFTCRCRPAHRQNRTGSRLRHPRRPRRSLRPGLRPRGARRVERGPRRCAHSAGGTHRCGTNHAVPHPRRRHAERPCHSARGRRILGAKLVYGYGTGSHRAEPPGALRPPRPRGPERGRVLAHGR